MNPTFKYDNTNKSKHHQHLGFGKMLLNKAEEIAKSYNYNKIAVISGVGVKEYYKKRGYLKDNTYMVKTFDTKTKTF